MKSFASRLGKGLMLGLAGAVMSASASFATSLVPCLQLEKATLKEYAQQYDFVAAIKFNSRNRFFRKIVSNRNWNFSKEYKDFSGVAIEEYSVDVIEYYKWKGGNPSNRINLAVLSFLDPGKAYQGTALVGANYVDAQLLAEKNVSAGARDILKNSIVWVGICGMSNYDEKSAVLAGQLRKF